LNPSTKIRRIIYTATQKNTAIFQFIRKFKTNFARTGWASGDIPHIPPSPTLNPYIIPAEEPTGEHENIVVKKLLDSSLEARKLLLKEARLINQLNHANIVEFKGICLDRYQRYALLMEYVYFDFRPIGHDLIVHNLICSGYAF
jgi:serine/threonine protein kinase